MKKKLIPWIFLLSLLASFLLLDKGIAYFGEKLWKVPYNDFEATRAAHPEKVWDKVFFGNSVVISAYREDVSEAGYVNLGMDYGVVRDLWNMLRKGQIEIGSELVIGLNLFTLYDEFDTNPAYLCHKKALVPYTYFHRDKLLRIFEDSKKLYHKEPISPWNKILYYGCMSEDELQGKLETYEEKYYNLPQSDFQENLKALDRIADWCEKEGVRLRILWMPYNPTVPQPALMHSLMETVDAWCKERQVLCEDFTWKLDESCFHDVGHLNYEHGSYIFTEVADQWLTS